MSLRKLVSLLVVLSMLTPGLSLLASTVASPDMSEDGTMDHTTGPRTVVETWTDTDWSGGSMNMSFNVEADLTPGELVLSSDINDMLELYDPTTRDGIYSLAELGGNLYLTASSPGTGLDHTAFYSCDAGTVQCQLVSDLEEDMVYEMSPNENLTRLYIPGALSTNASVNGGVYVFNGTNVSLLQVGDITSDSIGIRSVYEHDNRLYAASNDDDANNRAYIYRSVNDGQVWSKQALTLLPKPYGRQFNAIGAAGDYVLVQPDGLADEGAVVYVNDGGSWVPRPIPGLTNDYGAFVDIGGVPYFLNAGYLYKYEDSAWVQVPAPFTPTVSGIEMYDSATDNITTVGDMILSRAGHTADLVVNGSGSVVMSGGIVADYPIKQVEVFEASTGDQTAAASMQNARAYHASAVIEDGVLLVTGGLSGGPPSGYLSLTSVEKYNLTNDQWTVASSLAFGRYNHTATLLADGRVLVTGGMNTGGGFLGTAEIYDPVGGSWSTASSMSVPRANQMAYLLANGTVLVAGGRDGSGAINDSELYDPAGDNWIDLGTIGTARYDATAFGSAAGVALCGGTNGSASFDTCVEYSSAGGTWGGFSSMTTERAGMAAIDLGGGEILAMGGLTTNGTVLSSIELYSGTWALQPPELEQARFGHKATVINSSLFLLTGGYRSTALNNSTFKAAAPYGANGIVVGSTDGRIHIMDGSGNWTSTSSGGPEIMDVMVHHGRVHASTRAPSKVFVASAVPTGTMVSVPHKYLNYAENMSIVWDAIQPAGTTLKFQVKSSRDLAGLNSTNFTGPDGTNSTYYDVSGTQLNNVHAGTNWFQYLVVMETNDPVNTTVIREVRLVMNGTPLVLTTIEVLPATITVTADDYVDFEATGYDQFGVEMPFIPSWSVESGSINPITGNFTPGDNGTWTVVARFFSLEGTAEVTVEPGVLASIDIDPGQWFGSTDGSVVFTAVGLDQRGNNASFDPVWAVSGGGTISATGNFTPTMPGTWRIYVNDSVTGKSANVTAVVWSGTPSRIDISPSDVTLQAGVHQQFSASVYDADGNVLETVVQWKVTGGGAINMLGNFTATTSGTWSVIANLTTYGVTAETGVTVTPGPLEDITVTPSTITMKAGETLSFNANPVDAYGNTLSINIRWSATGGGGFSNGVFTPTKTGIWIIYANASGSSTKVEVVVLPGDLYEVLVTATDGSAEPVVVEGGSGKQFNAQGVDEFGNSISGLTYVWTVPDTIGRIDNMGGFIAGAKKGTGQITCTAREDSITKTGTIDIEVMKTPQPIEPGDPIYYFLLEIVVMVVLVLVVVMVIVELRRKA